MLLTLDKQALTLCVGLQVSIAQDSKVLSEYPGLLLYSLGNTAVKFGFTAYMQAILAGLGSR